MIFVHNHIIEQSRRDVIPYYSTNNAAHRAIQCCGSGIQCIFDPSTGSSIASPISYLPGETKSVFSAFSAVYFFLVSSTSGGEDIISVGDPDPQDPHVFYFIEGGRRGE